MVMMMMMVMVMVMVLLLLLLLMMMMMMTTEVDDDDDDCCLDARTAEIRVNRDACSPHLGLPGSATREDSSCSMPSGPMASSRSGPSCFTISVMASRTIGSLIGKNMSCRLPKMPFMPRQFTPPKRSEKPTSPLVTAALELSLSSFTYCNSLSAVPSERTPVMHMQPSVSRTLLDTSGLEVTT